MAPNHAAGLTLLKPPGRLTLLIAPWSIERTVAMSAESDSVWAALEQHGAWIMGAAGITSSADVTEIKCTA